MLRDLLHGVIRLLGRNLDHDVAAEDPRREEDPEDIVKEQADQTDGRDLRWRWAYEGRCVRCVLG